MSDPLQPPGARPAPPGPRPFVLVTGLSGAGKASILRVLEDLGFETVDNPPLKVLEELVDDGEEPIAAGIDTRTRGFVPTQALVTLGRLRRRPGIAVSLVYVTAEDTVLLRRYTETRRRHPLAPGGSLGNRVIEGIRREKELLTPLQDAADLVIDTSDLAMPALRQLIERRFRRDGMPGLNIQVMSFAFPKGLPREADLVFDVRFLRNPHYVPDLKPLTGRDRPVADYVEGDADFPGFWNRLTGFIDPLLPRYVAEGKKYLTVALGCTGGKHRSVLVAERLVDHLRSAGWRADVTHRELSQRETAHTALAGIDPAGMTGPRSPASPESRGAAGGEAAPALSDGAGGREALSRTP